MRIISMHKATKDMEAGAPPPPAVLEGMGPLMEEITRAGIFEAGEGLRPSAHGVRVTFRGGERTITPGPFTSTNAPIDRYLIVRVPTIDDAIEWAARFAGDRDAEVDVRPVTEPWDLGFFPKPPDVTTTRYMILGASGTPDGTTVLASETFQPDGVRLQFRAGRITVMDGPFTESKELIAGFSIMELPSLEDAIPWATRFASLFDELEIDIRPLA
jgi:hypothetical protein